MSALAFVASGLSAPIDDACPAPMTVTVRDANANVDTQTVTEYVTVNAQDTDAPGTVKTTTTTTKRMTITNTKKPAAKTSAQIYETTRTRTLYEIRTLEGQCSIPAPV